MNNQQSTVYIICGVHNNLDHTRSFLQCISKQYYPKIKAVIIDDGSDDGTSEFIRENYNEVEIIKGDGNLWWTGAMARGVEYVLNIAKSSDYIVTINNDCIFEADYIQKLVNDCEKNKRAIVGSLALDVDNPEVIWDGGVKINWKRGSIYGKKIKNISEIKGLDYDDDVDTLTTKGTIYPIEIFKLVGNFDEKRLPHYLSDYEFGCRAKKKGIKLILSYNARVYNDTKRTGLGDKLSNGLSFGQWREILFNKRSRVNIVDHYRFIKLCCPFKYKPVNYFLLVVKFFYYLSLTYPFNFLKKSIKKTFKRFSDNKFLVGFIVASLLVLVALNFWIWPTPDEYYYATTARIFSDALNGSGTCLSCLNTEHTYLVQFIAGTFGWLFKISPFNMMSLRFAVFVFSVGTMINLWLIGNMITRKKQERILFLMLLMLIPGFYVFSTRLMLDVPLTYAVSLLMLALLKKKNIFLISLVLLLLLSIKEYGFFLCLPIVLLHYILENRSEQNLLKRNMRTLKSFIVVNIFPALGGIFFLFYSAIPYPRLLESNLIQYFGNAYYFFVKVVWEIIYLFSKFFHVFNQTDLLANINGISMQSTVPMAIFESPLQPEVNAGFFGKLWLIYKYNFSAQDVNIFLLSFFLVGMIYVAKCLIDNKNDERRKLRDFDYLMFSLVAVFGYLNWHEALNIHGFRLTIPIIIAMVYFAFWGIKIVILENKYFYKKIFIASFVLFFLLYMKFLNEVGPYSSSLSKNNVASFLLYNKIYIYGFLYIAIAIFIIVFNKLKWRYKNFCLFVIPISLLFINILPFYLDNKLALKAYSYDYGMPSLYENVSKKISDGNIATNVNSYTLYYYLGDTMTPNIDISSAIRIFPEIKEDRYIWLNSIESINEIKKNNARYILLINKSDYSNLLNEIKKTYPSLNLIERYAVGGVAQWELYSLR